MSSKAALALHGVSKRYNLGVSQGIGGWGQMWMQRTTMADIALRKLRHPLQREERAEFWALRDVTFSLDDGDVLGLVGRNGAGKSTMLKVISRITDLTEGRIDLYGRVGSLLEVGTGFHPELTGRENIFLNGSILGMRRREIEHEFEAIVDFAGVEHFLDTPVKRFSSGMMVRLAFSIAAHLRTEILLVDEVLAVGDKAFRDKCLGKLSSVAESGRTVIYVSHLMETVTQLCTKAVLLEKGKLTMEGSPDEVVNSYLLRLAEASDLLDTVDTRPGFGAFRLIDAKATEDIFAPSEEKVVEFVVARRDRTFADHFYANCRIVDARENVVAWCDTRLVDTEITAGDEFAGRFRIRSPWMRPGRYRVDLGLESRSGVMMDEAVGACFLEVSPRLPYPGASRSREAQKAHVVADFTFEALGGSAAASAPRSGLAEPGHA